MKKKTIENIIAAAAFLVLGVFWYAKSLTIKLTSAAASLGGTPRTIPQIISVLLILVSAVLIIETVICERKERKTAAAGSEPAPKEPLKRFLGVAVVLAAAILYCLFIDTITYLPASIVLMAIVAWCFEIRKPLPLILLTVLTPTILYVVFRYLLSVPLP
ncbi:MAG: tripartite tricarboxylate transporter TctB family protein [Clostridiales bacterium]|nr:tripartite tricarboxylate transporter TctB family protein [Clostridiales bacterium]